jgi:hypothetical protein
MAWTAPKTNVGDVVLHHMEPGDPGTPGIVTRLATRDGRMLDVLVFGGRSLTPRTGLRHEDDPALEKMERNDVGTWSLSKSASDIQARLAYLESQLAALRKKA